MIIHAKVCNIQFHSAKLDLRYTPLYSLKYTAKQYVIENIWVFIFKVMYVQCTLQDNIIKGEELYFSDKKYVENVKDNR